MYTLGVDCHKKYSQVAVLNEQGKLIMNQSFPNSKQLSILFLNISMIPVKQ